MTWGIFLLMFSILIVAAQEAYYRIKGAPYKFKNPFTPTLLALLLAGLATVINSYVC